MSNDERVERALEEALATYSSQEPLAGLEQRVLKRVYAARATALRRWALAAAMLAAAGLVLAVALWKRAPEPVSQASVRHAVQSVPVAAPPATPAAAPRRRRHTIPSRFPTPAPLSPEERALLAFVAHAPVEAQKSFTEKQEFAVRPVSIEQIKIDPLKIQNLE